MRRAALSRKTKETDIQVSVDLDGTGTSTISTGVGFFDHMLDQLARHGLIDLDVRAAGDLHVDMHHTVEDVGAFDTQLVREFFQAFTMNAGITLHVETLYGVNDHHIAESCFKGLARALRTAVALDNRQADRVPSTKGALGG